MTDLISVLMCVYNTPVDYLTEAVESILHQTYDNIEFIVVDDASTDDKVIQYLKTIGESDKRAIIVRNTVNLGLTRSLNVGLPMCLGKYIARMDSDDISLPERIQKQYEYMEQNPDVALAGSNIISFDAENDEDTEPDRLNDIDDPEIYRIRSLFRHSGPPHPTFMFRAAFLRDNGINYREDILKAQDYGIMADILKAGGTIRRINEPLLKYRVHPGQITFNSEIEQKAYQCRVSHDYLHLLFPTLSEVDCAALSLLGCDHDIRALIDVIMGSANLRTACGFIVDSRSSLENSSSYISAVKKIIDLNKDQNIFDISVFESQLRVMWWKKALRTSKRVRRLWGMCPFTLFSYKFTSDK